MTNLMSRLQKMRGPRFNVPTNMRATRRAPAPIAVLPLGAVPEAELRFVDEVIGAVFGARTLRLAEVPLAPSWFDRARDQYDADRLLEVLFEALPDHALRIVGVLDAGMFAAGRTSVFGYAHLRDGMAVCSLARLREERFGRTGDQVKYHDRLYRTLVHELGHTFGNPHCEDDACVMRAVCGNDPSVGLDVLGPNYCEPCMRRVRRGVEIAPASAEGRFQRAGALLRHRHVPRAIQTYHEAVEKAPHEPRYRNDLGVALLAAADRERARLAFLRATELAADFPHPYYNLGILCRETGGSAAAERWFDEALRRDPDRIAAHRYLARLYEDLFGDTERARRHYSAYISLGGHESEVLQRTRALGAGR